MEHLTNLGPDAREAKFRKIIEGGHGGSVDWNSLPDEVYEVIFACLSPEEQERFPDVSTLPAGKPEKVVESLASNYTSGPRAIRAIETFGDDIIVLMVPRDRVPEFDRTAKYWLA
jgi:hypothetical protein